ncbi:MAG: hypothetical protein LBJ46_04405 [Planctomycetota bacterium]|nr:hypothetical protein [Planctomycetota bacterium]
MSENFLPAIGLPLWWAVAFAAAAGSFRRVKNKADPGLRFLLFIIIIAVYAMFSIMPYRMLFVAVPLIVIFAFVPKWWFRIGVFLVSVVMVVGLYTVFSRFSEDRRDAKGLLYQSIAGDRSPGWEDALAQIAGTAALEDLPEIDGVPGKPSGRDSFTSDLVDESTPFIVEAVPDFAGLAARIPVPAGFSLRTAHPGDGFLTVLLMTGPGGDLMLAAAPDYAKLPVDGPGLEAVRLAYAEPEAMRRDLRVFDGFAAAIGYSVEGESEPDIAQNTGEMIIAYAPTVLVPGIGMRPEGHFGIEVDVFAGALELAGESRRFLVMAMFSDMDVGLKTAMTWLTRLAAENPPPSEEGTDDSGGNADAG